MTTYTIEQKRVLIENALKNFVITPRPKTILVNDQVRQWLNKYGIVFETELFPTGEARGFKQEGVSSLIELTAIVRKEKPVYRRGMKPEKLAACIAHSIITVFGDRLTTIPVSRDIAAVEEEIRRRFSAESGACTHYIPCRIIPEHASPFSVGPVKLYSKEDLIRHENLSTGDVSRKLSYDPLLEFMEKQSAYWVAEVTVEGFDRASGLERANVAVDLALTAVQIAIPLYYSRNMVRLTSRTFPNTIGSVTKVGDHARFGWQRCDPGLGFSAGALDRTLLGAASILVSSGNRVEAYITDRAALSKLDRGWSDAAYWFREGLAEPLDTVAITKLETAIEVLLSAASSKGSSCRLESAFSAFYGLLPESPYPPGSTQKVKDIVKAIVGSRSRILHGTLSTLTADSLATDDHGGRRLLELLCMDLITTFSLKLDAYSLTTDPSDEIEEFLEFVKATREAEISERNSSS